MKRSLTSVGASLLLVAAAVGLAAQARPAVPFESPGVCPFECCTYREWTVDTDTRVLTERRDGAPAAFTVTRGSRVVGVTGVVVTTRFGQAKVLKPATLGERRTPVRTGERVTVIHYTGEGVYKYWLRGETDADFIPDPET